MIDILRDEIRSMDRSRKALRSFGCLVGGILLFIAGVLYWRAGWSAVPAVYVFGSVGGALLFSGVAAPSVLKPIHVGWMVLAVLLGFIMTRVILTLVFYLVVTPTGLIMRATGRDPLRRKLDKSASTYWLEKSYDDDSPKRLEKYY